MPNVVRDELFNRLLPLFLEQALFTHNFQLIHESVNVLNQDVIACDQHLLLLASIMLLFMVLLTAWLLCRLRLIGVACHWSTLRVVLSLPGNLLWGLLQIVVVIALETLRLFSILVRCRLDLSLATPRVVLGRASCSILVLLLVLLIGCRWQLDFISKLFLWVLAVREYCQLSIVFNNFITEEHFCDDFVVWSHMLEERVIHLTTA